MQPLPKDSETRIEWVRARHEVKIRSAFLSWQDDTHMHNARPPTLSAQQQSELQTLLVARSVQLGEAEGRERLSLTLDPGRFENEVHGLAEIVSAEARERWKSLTSTFHLEASTDGVYADVERAVSSRVQEALRSSSDRLILDAWAAYEKRLQAECESTNPEVSNTRAETEEDLVSHLRTPNRSSETLSQKVDRLRLDKGMSIEKLALEAGVDKKTVLRITHKGKRATPATLKKLADALGVAASSLAN
jgi:DNA-binding Xre family transcriptional regulator